MSTKEAQLWGDPSIAEKYLLAENATRPFAYDMVKSMGFGNFDGEAHVFDFACGTGALIKELYDILPKEKWNDVKVLGGDVSVPMLEFLKARGEQEGWTGLSTKVVDGNNIQLDPNQFTHLFISFGIFMMPDNVLRKCSELLKPGGEFAISTWEYLPWYPYAARAVALLPEDERPTMPSITDVENAIYMKRPFNDTGYVSTILQNAGFTDVNVTTREVEVAVGTPAQFCDAMFMPLKMVSSFWVKDQSAQGDEEKNRLVKAVQEKMQGILKEESGKDGITRMKFKAIMGYGKKA